MTAENQPVPGRLSICDGNLVVSGFYARVARPFPAQTIGLAGQSPG
ncbi:MAG TPA: hypothetical protein VN870_01470 [Streptosporangiaceae bacterium]|nr:hypothetical protein [Streptosporangiaceae bacterium]